MIKRPAVIGVCVALGLLFSAAVLPFQKFDGRIDVMLPDDSDLRDVFGFLREIQVADKVLLTFSMRDGSSNPEVLAAAADGFLSGVDSAWATPLMTGLQGASVSDDMANFLRRLPDFFTEDEQNRLQKVAASGEAVRASLRTLKNRLQQPGSLWTIVSPGSDPFDWNGRLAATILRTVSSFGYRAVPVGAHLMDPEKRHLLLVLQTPVLMTDTAGCRELLAHLSALTESLPPEVTVSTVSGHLHTLHNEDIIRRDIQRTVWAIIFVFLFLFWGVYRDAKAGFILLIPMVACVPALALASMLFSSFSFIVLGFGSVIAGIAVDYGIHSYVAARSDRPEVALAGIRRPVILSALTTLCVFVAFCFSSIPGYRQLGVFAVLAILFSLGLALWVLPLIVRNKNPKKCSPNGEHGFFISRRVAWGVVFAAVVLLVLGMGMLSRISLDSDISKLDGTPQEILDEEARALSIWGGGASLSAILVVEAETEAVALRMNDALYRDLRAAGLPAGAISSLAPLWPSDETRQARRTAWNSIWTAERIADLKVTTAEASAEFDFSEQAFAPFWERFSEWGGPVAPVEPTGFLEGLRKPFIHERDGVVSVLTFVPDEPEWIAAVQKIQNQMPALRVISRRAFSADLSSLMSGEMLHTTGWAAVLILLVTGCVLRRWGMWCLAGLPAVAGMVWGGAGMVWSGLSLNVSNLVAGILVFGLCIDYGICMTFGERRGLRNEMFRAVMLSVLTTVLGAAVLLLAKHPAFLSIGITLVFGVSVGALYAMVVVPALQVLFPRLNPPDVPAKNEGAS